MRPQGLKDRVLDAFLFGRGLDDQIARPQIPDGKRRFDPRHGIGLGLCRHFAACDLTFNVAVNRCQGFRQAVFADVIHQHIISCQGKDMGNPVAHLPRTYDPDCLNGHSSPPKLRRHPTPAAQKQQGRCTAARPLVFHMCPNIPGCGAGPASALRFLLCAHYVLRQPKEPNPCS